MTFMTSGGCVYVMSVPSGAYKIGLAADPDQRRRELQCGNPEPISLEGATWPVNSVGAVPARELEQMLHRMLAADRVCGEWFRIEFDRLVRAFHLAWRTLYFRSRFDPTKSPQHKQYRSGYYGDTQEMCDKIVDQFSKREILS